MAIVVPIIADYNGKGVRDAERSLSAFTTKASASLTNLARLGGVVFAGLAVERIASFGFSLVAAGEAALASDRRLLQINQSMGLFGDSTKAVTQRMIEYAEKVSAATGVDDDQIKAVQAKLATFKDLAKQSLITGDTFDRATKAAIDLSAAGFGDAASNAVSLGKALQNPIKGLTALSRSGITFTKQEEKRIKQLVRGNKLQEAQRIILNAVETQVGGTAEATATATGKLAVAFDNLKENVGIALLPLFERFSAVLTDKVFPAIQSISDAFKTGGIGGAFRKLFEYFEPAKDGLIELIKRIGRWIISDGVPLLASKLADLGQALVDWIGPKIPGAITKLETFLADLGTWITQTGIPLFAATMSKIGDKLVDWIEPRIQPALDQLGVYFERVAVYILTDGVPAVARAFNELERKSREWLARLLPNTIAGIKDFVVRFVEELPALFAPILGKIAATGEQIGAAFVADLIRVIGTLPTALTETIAGLLPKLANIGKEIGRAIANGIIDIYNRIDPGIGGIDLLPDIPRLAAGGIVTSPTLALIGEAGPEAVIPLDKTNRGFSGTTVNIYGAIDPVATARQVQTVLSRDQQRQGFAA